MLGGAAFDILITALEQHNVPEEDAYQPSSAGESHVNAPTLRRSRDLLVADGLHHSALLTNVEGIREQRGEVTHVGRAAVVEKPPYAWLSSRLRLQRLLITRYWHGPLGSSSPLYI